MQIEFYDEIRKRYGNIKRTRGFYLYTEKGCRLLDMFLDEGRTILGRKRGQSLLVFKQFLNRGLTAFLPSTADMQLEKSLKALFPQYQIIRFYDCDYKIKKTIEFIINRSSTNSIVWRPFMQVQTLAEAFLVYPPLPVKGVIAVCKKEFETDLPINDKILPAEAAFAARFFFDLKKELDIEKDAEYSMEKVRGKTAKRKIARKLNSIRLLQDELKKIWTINGIYLFPNVTPDEYKNIFFKALDSGILISPYFDTPSILPDIDVYTSLLNFLKTFSK